MLCLQRPSVSRAPLGRVPMSSAQLSRYPIVSNAARLGHIQVHCQAASRLELEPSAEDLSFVQGSVEGAFEMLVMLDRVRTQLDVVSDWTIVKYYELAEKHGAALMRLDPNPVKVVRAGPPSAGVAEDCLSDDAQEVAPVARSNLYALGTPEAVEKHLLDLFEVDPNTGYVDVVYAHDGMFYKWPVKKVPDVSLMVQCAHEFRVHNGKQ